jgi:hypothetical protein
LIDKTVVWITISSIIAICALLSSSLESANALKISSPHVMEATATNNSREVVGVVDMAVVVIKNNLAERFTKSVQETQMI